MQRPRPQLQRVALGSRVITLPSSTHLGRLLTGASSGLGCQRAVPLWIVQGSHVQVLLTILTAVSGKSIVGLYVSSSSSIIAARAWTLTLRRCWRGSGLAEDVDDPAGARRAAAELQAAIECVIIAAISALWSTALRCFALSSTWLTEPATFFLAASTRKARNARSSPACSTARASHGSSEKLLTFAQRLPRKMEDPQVRRVQATLRHVLGGDASPAVGRCPTAASAWPTITPSDVGEITRLLDHDNHDMRSKMKEFMKQEVFVPVRERACQMNQAAPSLGVAYGTDCVGC